MTGAFLTATVRLRRPDRQDRRSLTKCPLWIKSSPWAMSALRQKRTFRHELIDRQVSARVARKPN
jgi:hypothetical protein